MGAFLKKKRIWRHRYVAKQIYENILKFYINWRSLKKDMFQGCLMGGTWHSFDRYVSINSIFVLGFDGSGYSQSIILVFGYIYMQSVITIYCILLQFNTMRGATQQAGGWSRNSVIMMGWCEWFKLRGCEGECQEDPGLSLPRLVPKKSKFRVLCPDNFVVFCPALRCHLMPMPNNTTFDLRYSRLPR